MNTKVSRSSITLPCRASIEASWAGQLIFSVSDLLDLVSSCNALSILRNYLGLTEALPLVRSGKIDELFDNFPKSHVLDSSRRVIPYVSLSTEIDRQRCVAIICAVRGYQNTFLREFFQRNLGWNIQPDFGTATLAYLKRVHLGCTAKSRIERNAVEGVICRLSAEIQPAILLALSRITGKSISSPIGWQRLCPKLTSMDNASWVIDAETMAEVENDYYEMAVHWCQEIALVGD